MKTLSRRPPAQTLLTPTKTAGTLAMIAAAVGLAGADAQAAGAERGGSCATPWKVRYSKRKVTGDTKEVSLKVTIKGRAIRVAWHARTGYTFCLLTLTEANGEFFQSTNPAASYSYLDTTTDGSDGLKTVTATARNSRKITTS